MGKNGGGGAHNPKIMASLPAYTVNDLYLKGTLDRDEVLFNK